MKPKQVSKPFMTKTLQAQLENPLTALETEIAEMGPWFHNLHLPDGTQTAPNHPLGDFPLFKWTQLQQYIPDDLQGWRVLDIGCNSGFYSFELARRGATVTAIDVDPHYLRQAEWAAKQFEMKDRISFACMPLYDIARLPETYDLIWFMGVLYHLRYPLLALDIISRKTKRLLVLQSLTTNDGQVCDRTHALDFSDIDRMSEPGWPAMAFIENDLQGDPTNWWIPNEACLQAMVRSTGLSISAHPAAGTYICHPALDPSDFKHLNELTAATGQLPPNPP